LDFLASIIFSQKFKLSQQAFDSCLSLFSKHYIIWIQPYSIKVGTKPMKRNGNESFVSTSYLDNLLAEMVQSHMVGDFCIVGPRGGGKSADPWLILCTPSNTAKLPSNAAITKGDNRHVVSPLGKVCRCCRRSRDVISWYNKYTHHSELLP
jgi:hypothetical protein